MADFLTRLQLLGYDTGGLQRREGPGPDIDEVEAVGEVVGRRGGQGPGVETQLGPDGQVQHVVEVGPPHGSAPLPLCT